MISKRFSARTVRLSVASLGLVGVAGCSTVPVPVAAPEQGRVPDARTSFDGPHVDFDAFLKRHVDESGSVDYAGARGDRADLDRYVAWIATVSPDSDPGAFPTEYERLAYWVNAYNAWVIAMVLDVWPIGSVLDVENALAWVDRRAGFFVLRRVVLGGDRMSLWSLENRVIRERFDEPRIHFALNCASRGCPRLPREVFLPQRLEEQLARETALFLGDERNVSIDLDARVVRLSSIFDWYASDFTGWMQRKRPQRPDALLGYVQDQAPEAVANRVAACEDCDVAFAPYDWRVNAAESTSGLSD